MAENSYTKRRRNKKAQKANGLTMNWKQSKNFCLLKIAVKKKKAMGLLRKYLSRSPWIHMCLMHFLTSIYQQKSQKISSKHLNGLFVEKFINKTEKSFSLLGCSIMMNANDCPMTTWWLPYDCLMTAWWLPDDCLMTAWWWPDNCPMPAWCTAWWRRSDCSMTAWWLSVDSWQPVDCLTIF